MANQREHLILLLANVQMRQFPKLDQKAEVSISCYISFIFLMCHFLRQYICCSGIHQCTVLVFVLVD